MITTIEIDRPPEMVYAYVTDPTRFPEWQADVVRVRMDDRRGVGARFTTVRRIAGAERSMVQQVSEYVPARRWASVAVGGPVRPVAAVDVAPIEGGRGSRVTFTLDFEGRGFGAALVPLVRRQAAKAAPVSYRRAKRNLEGR